MDKEVVFIQLTQQWAETWIYLLSYIKEILEHCIREWYKTLYDVQINGVAKKAKFVDQDWILYTEEEQRRAEKDMIHTFIGMRDMIKKVYLTDNLSKIIKRFQKTIKKLQSTKHNLPH